MTPDPLLTKTPGAVRPVARVLVATTAMLSFISFWRAAAIVLNDMGSSAFYAGAIAEEAFGKAAPWFILAVMLLAYAVCTLYMESCSMFVRGGVYRVVREALGRFLAKIAVSALMFDYILTGPISGVTAGQYLIGLGLEVYAYATGSQIEKATQNALTQWGSVFFACAITLYFFRKNIIGLHESSDKALKIIFATTVMAVVIFAWCGVTLWVEGPKASVLREVDLRPKTDYSAEEPATALFTSCDWESVPSEQPVSPKLMFMTLMP